MTEPVDPIIRAQAVEKFYVQPDGNRIEVIAPVDLDVEPGKIITLLGPSGCGKSTLLRILTGLSKPSSGEVLWHGRPITSQNAGVAIVFQSFALFPWLTVLDNVEAPLEARGVPALERHKRALRILDTVGLDGFESAYPKELSGGMKQRVAYARVGGIAGLLELLQDRGGKEYLHRLAEVLSLDAEDLLPIVEAAVLLGFATLKEGDVQITAEGIRFAEADILARKILFRQAALKHIMILQQIDSVLHAKTDHSIPEEFFYDILDEHFTQDEVERQFETAMNWGRYAEIFDFDRASHRLILAEPVSEPHPPTTTPVQS